MVHRNTVFVKGRGSMKVQMKGRGMGSMLLGGSGSASAMVNGPSVGEGLGAGILSQVGLRSDGVMGIKKKVGNIKF